MEDNMNSVKRVYVEKKQEFAVQAKELKQELKSYLGIQTVENVRVLIRYDIENISDATFETACNGIFSEPPVDILYKEEFEVKEGSRIFSVEYLPGQFDQRADSAVQCVQFIKEDEMPVIKSATTYVIEGAITDEEFAANAKTTLSSTFAFVNMICPTITPSISATNDNSGIYASPFLNALTKSCSFPSACTALPNAFFTTEYIFS